MFNDRLLIHLGNTSFTRYTLVDANCIGKGNAQSKCVDKNYDLSYSYSVKMISLDITLNGSDSIVLFDLQGLFSI